MIDIKKIEGMARDVRELFESVLASSLGTRETQGSCLYASILLKELMSKFLGVQATVRGGGGGMDGGFGDVQGLVRGHYWTEVACPESGQRWVVDVTADQFGEERVRVLAIEEAVQYTPGSQNVVDGHVEDEMNQISLIAKMKDK